ncbi:MAG: hypothetical protein ACXVRK_02905 [Gaiellaceae bacterium]
MQARVVTPHRPELPTPILSDDDYWLKRCEGFSVEGPDGDLGVVSEVHYRSQLDRPDELVVRSGLLGNRLTVVPVSEVIEVRPEAGRIVLNASHARRSHTRFPRIHNGLAAIRSG